MVSTPECLTYKIPMSVGTSGITKKTSANKSLNKSSELLDVKQKTSVFILGASKKGLKEIRKDLSMWSVITKNK